MAKPTQPTNVLSEAEKRDLIQLIQADKPLPDKYRFLLFEDKREVELVWNGKTADVCNAVLPFQTLSISTSRGRKPRFRAICSTPADGKRAAGPTSSSGATTS